MSAKTSADKEEKSTNIFGMATFQNHRLLWSIFTFNILILCCYILSLNNSDTICWLCWRHSNGEHEANNDDKTLTHQNADGSCPGVLSGMMTGKWKTRPLTKKEHDEIFAFLFNAHSRYRLPSTYQRSDSLCGNVTYLGVKDYRALCDPKGKTPCCYHNKCTSKTAVECECGDCYDMRNMKHAEYSTWIPSHTGCTYHEHTAQEACDILNEMDIAFVGDSLVRHVYTAMLLVVTGNMKDGAMKPGTPEGTKENCQGMYMFTEKMCRKFLATSLNGCGGKVKLRFFSYYSSTFGKSTKRIASAMKEKSLLFMGIGIHDKFKYTKVQTSFVNPIFQMMKNTNKAWPRLLWVANHAPGILKSPIFTSQTSNKVINFNKEMKKFLDPLNIPIFNTYNITDGMMSFDGEHYGMGMNLVKANILLSYLKEIKSKEKW